MGPTAQPKETVPPTLDPAHDSAPEPGASGLLNHRFEILGALGAGGQGSVFEALDRSTGQRVAVKRAKVSWAHDDKRFELFSREWKALGNLHHPGIPRLVDHFELPGELCLVMELVEGRSLRTLQQAGERFTEAEIWRLLREVGAILDYLHGFVPPVIHRDIKPQNVIRRPNGSYALVDFGLIRDRYRGSSASTFGGTEGYAAPEQSLGLAHPATDLYALGMTALVLVSGRDPEDLPIEVDRRGIPAGIGISPQLRRALERLLEPDWQKRPGSLVAALAGPARAPKRELDPPGRRWNPWGYVVGAVLMLVVGGVNYGVAVLSHSWTSRTLKPQLSWVDRALSPARKGPLPDEPSTEIGSTHPASASDPRVGLCEAWLSAAEKGTWNAGLAIGLGERAGLAKRIALWQLLPEDLELDPENLPCHEIYGGGHRHWQAHVGAARATVAAWAKPSKPTHALLQALAGLDPPLLDPARRTLQQRVAGTARRALASSSLAEVDGARELCEVEVTLGLPQRSAGCGLLQGRRSAIEDAAKAEAERCAKSRQAVAVCQTECTFKLDLFDPRMKDCDHQCAKELGAPGCKFADLAGTDGDQSGRMR